MKTIIFVSPTDTNLRVELKVDLAVSDSARFTIMYILGIAEDMVERFPFKLGDVYVLEDIVQFAINDGDLNVLLKDEEETTELYTIPE